MRITLLTSVLLWAVSLPANATLFDRGNGMIYDDVLDVTWLQDANLSGSMNWNDAAAWADGLSFGGFDDWRLASMDVNGDGTIVNCNLVSEADCRDAELAYMYYYNLMGNMGDNLTGDQGPFTNIQASYWSGTDFGSDPNLAWGVDYSAGNYLAGNKATFLWSAWAVRDGDVGTTPDTDEDGITDDIDNCTAVANPLQEDTDADGHGNICDADFDQSCLTNFVDLNFMQEGFFGNDPLLDLDSSGVVNFGDLNIMAAGFFQAPGPSAQGAFCNP